MSVLFREGEWMIEDHYSKGDWAEATVIAHNCKNADFPLVWTSLNARREGHCYFCETDIPDSIITLQILLNWDVM